MAVSALWNNMEPVRLLFIILILILHMASEKLIEDLLDARAKNSETKIKVLYALGKLKNKIPENVQDKVVEKILRFSSDPDAKVRCESISIMHDLYNTFSGEKREEIDERLLELCRDQDSWVLFKVKEAVRKLNLENKAAERILSLSKSPHTGRRSKAIELFKNTRTLIPADKICEVVKSLSSLCHDERLVVRISAIKQIKYAEKVPDVVQEELDNALLNACSDHNWIVRYGAVRTVCSRRDYFSGGIINKIFDIFLNLFSDEKWEIRFSTIQSVGRMRSIIPDNSKSKILTKISSMSDDDNNRIVRESAKKSLERLQKS